MAFLSHYSSDELNRSLHSAADKLGIEDFRAEQRESLQAFLRGEDVFVNLPTGFGKSAIFQAAPFCWDFLRQTESPSSIAIIVSPLSALMKDQLVSLSSRGIKAACLTKETPQVTKSAITRGQYSLVFASPEALAKSGRALLTNDVYRKNLCGIFVDESHCIKKWGFGEGKVKAFREEYAHLGELRSMAPRTLPVVALTATATAVTRATIIKSLGLNNPSIVMKSPRRENIKYVVMKTKERDIANTFRWKITDLKENGHQAERLIIYCRTKVQCNRLYATFEHELKPTCNEDRYFAKFHAQTDADVKQYVSTNFQKPDSHIRVLFATVAFGMGLDAKNVHAIVHYGLPHDIEEFVQESGRAGRDGKPSVSILLSYPGAGSTTRPNQDMRDFVSSKTCRRALAFHHFDGDDGSSGNHHSCCDICFQSCICGQEDCARKSDVEQALLLTIATTTSKQFPQRNISSHDKQTLMDELTKFRSSLFGDGISSHYLAGGDITSGFPLATCQRIADECHLVLTSKQFQERYAFYENSLAEYAFEIVQSTLAECPIISVQRADPACMSSETTEEVESSASGECQRPVLFSSSTDSN